MEIGIRDNLNPRNGIALTVREPLLTYPGEVQTVVHFDSIETLEAAIKVYKDSKAEETKKALREKHTKFKVGDIVRLTGAQWSIYGMRGRLTEVVSVDDDDHKTPVVGESGARVYWTDNVDYSATKIGEVTE